MHIKKHNFQNFIILFSIVAFLHLLRNVTSIYYALLLLFMFANILYIFTNLQKSICGVTVFSLLIAYITIISILSNNNDDPTLGIFRLFYLTPFVIFLFSTKLSPKQEKSMWYIILIFITLSSLSLLFQYLTGPISWFAESSERAGETRFASLAGSLTVYGSIVGIGIIIATYYESKNIKILFYYFIFIIGTILSLQKMAIMNFILAFSLLLTTKGIPKEKKKKLLYLLFIISIGCLPILINHVNTHQYITYIISMILSDTSRVYDVSIWQSIIDRFTQLPMVVIDYWGLDILLGIGVYGGAGGLGYPHYPMAHNLAFEIIFIFGLPIGLIILYYLSKYFLYAILNIFLSNEKEIKLSCMIYVLSTTSSIFTGSLFYHPVIGIIFWFSASNIFKHLNHVQKQNTPHYRRHRLLWQRRPQAISEYKHR